MKRVISQICQPEGQYTTNIREKEQRKMQILMYEWNLQQCFRTTGQSYLLSINFSQNEADEFMQKFVPLVAPGNPPARKKQKSDPPSLEFPLDNENDKASKQTAEGREIDQYKDLTKAKLVAKMHELGMTDYNPRWKKQQLIDQLDQFFSCRKIPAVNDPSSTKNLPAHDARMQDHSMDDSRVETAKFDFKVPIKSSSPTRGLVQRAIAQHENRNTKAGPVREVSCESAAKQPRLKEEITDNDHDGVVPVGMEIIDDRNILNAVVSLDMDIMEDRNIINAQDEIIDLTMSDPDPEVEKIAREPARIHTKKMEKPYPEASAPLLKATTPKKCSPSIQLGTVKSAKKMLLGNGLADPQNPVRPTWKQPVVYHSAAKKKPVGADLSVASKKSLQVDELAAEQRPVVAELSAAKQKPEPTKLATKQPPPQENLRTPSATQIKPLTSPSYAYKMKERHAKLLRERSKRVDQMMSSKNPSTVASKPSTADLNDNPATLFKGPEDAQRVLDDIRMKYKISVPVKSKTEVKARPNADNSKTEVKAPVAQPYCNTSKTEGALLSSNKSKTEAKAPGAQPQMPLSVKPTNHGNEAKPRPLLPSKDTNNKSTSVRSVYESYEMTDTENSEYDTEDSEAKAERRAKKKIPSWARSKRLRLWLAIQEDPSFPSNPDELFGKVTSCDLEAVFDRKSSRYRQPRTSGVWVSAKNAAA